MIRSEKFAQNVDAAEAAVPGTREKILSGKVKPTAAELAAVSRAAPEERPGLVAELCRPRQEKRTARERAAVQDAEAPLPELPKPNTGQRSQSRRILKSLREMSEKMLQPTGEANADDICYELGDALPAEQLHRRPSRTPARDLARPSALRAGCPPSITNPPAQKWAVF